jgi:hypothetical protein
MMIPNRVAIALQDAGWYIRSEIIGTNPIRCLKVLEIDLHSCHEKIWLITKLKNLL